MTHTLHRTGTPESLGDDYVMLIMASRGINLDGSSEKIKQIWTVLSRYEPSLTNFGTNRIGNSHQVSLEDLANRWKDANRIGHAVFHDREALKACLRELKDGDFGISIVISGLCGEIDALCAEIGLSPHTVEYSLDVQGTTERLPTMDILEITTMCGHALVSPHLVEEMIRQIHGGRKTYAEAARELSRICDCGVFNPYRAEKLLRVMISKETL
jgi:hypothetical protein